MTAAERISDSKRSHTPDLPWINGLDCLTQQLAEHAAGMHAKGKHASEGS
jgi:hypothetical protein